MTLQAHFTSRTDETRGLVEERSTRQEDWKNFVDQHVCAFTYRAQASSTFSLEARARSVQGFSVARLVTAAGPAQMQRGSVDIARDGRVSYAFYLPTRGYQEIHQFNRIQRCPEDSLVAISTSEPFLQLKPGDNDTTCLIVAADFVDGRALHIEDRCALVVPATNGLPRLFRDSLIALEQESSTMTESQFLSAIHTVSELGILAVSASEDFTADSNSVRGSNLANAKRVIRRRLTEPTLTLLDIAAECDLSLRYLHKLFREDGRSMSDYLMSERLQYARDLLQRASARATVTDICFASGFSNASQFSTAFRRAFGVCPREVLHRRPS
jgi:AraC-like DNA-binding protein